MREVFLWKSSTEGEKKQNQTLFKSFLLPKDVRWMSVVEEDGAEVSLGNVKQVIFS